MAETKTAGKKAPRTRTETFSADEKAAMREYAAEKKKAAGRKGGKDEDGEADVLAKIAEMPAADRHLAERIHAIVKASAPGLTSRTWYGMPAYALDGKVVCFFQPASKFKARYGTLGFSDTARLDDGQMWPNSFAITKLTPADEQRIAALVKKAVG